MCRTDCWKSWSNVTSHCRAQNQKDSLLTATGKNAGSTANCPPSVALPENMALHGSILSQYILPTLSKLKEKRSRLFSSITSIFKQRECVGHLRELASRCRSVICCRMSPLQKAEIVKMMKESPEGPVTSAVGDGANDVAMIQASIFCGQFSYLIKIVLPPFKLFQWALKSHIMAELF